MSFADRLADAHTRWDLACLLLELWRTRPRGRAPARRSRNDRVRDRFYGRVDEVRAHFDEAPDTFVLRPIDRDHVLDWTDLGQDADMVDAVAHGLHLAASATFAQCWREQLGVDRHRLAAGEIYPAADAPWPPQLGVAQRTPSARSLGIEDDEHLFARVHRAGEIAVEVDFSLWAPLKALAEDLVADRDRLAAVFPNEALAELGWDAPRPVAFPVGPADPSAQEATVLGLVRAAVEQDARVVVLPELSATPEIVERVAEALAEDDDERLVVCGSAHVLVEGRPANVATGLISGRPERLTHRKLTEVDNPFPADPAERFREGVEPGVPPVLRIYVAGAWRFAVLVCKDFLDPRVRDILQRLAVNVLLVPSMSETTQPFKAAALGHVAASQGLSLCVNGPRRWGRREPRPAALLVRPFSPRDVVEAPVVPAPGVVVFALTQGTAVPISLPGL